MCSANVWFDTKSLRTIADVLTGPACGLSCAKIRELLVACGIKTGTRGLKQAERLYRCLASHIANGGDEAAVFDFIKQCMANAGYDTDLDIIDFRTKKLNLVFSGMGLQIDDHSELYL